MSTTESQSAPLAPDGLASDLRERHARITARLQELDAACLVAIRDQSVTYLTGYTTMTWKMYSRPLVAVLAADGRLMVLAAETEVDSVRLRVPGADVRPYGELRPVTEDMRLPDGRVQFAPQAAELLGGIIEDAGSGRVAVEGLDAVWPPIGQLTRLIPGLEGRTSDASELVWSLRLRKSEWELGRMREASRVLDRAYTLLRDQVKPGMTERDIARQFGIAQLEAGAHDVGHFAVVAGVNRGLFGFPTERVWNADDLLFLDGAAIVDGYWSDYCRTFAAREVSRQERAGYARVRTALDEVSSAGRAGGTAGELGNIIAGAMDIAPGDVGFGRFGHGIGLHVPEPPSLHADDSTPLAEGCTLCLEPTVVHAGLNFVVEEEHVVAAAGLERLMPKAPEEILTV